MFNIGNYKSNDVESFMKNIIGIKHEIEVMPAEKLRSCYNLQMRKEHKNI